MMRPTIFRMGSCVSHSDYHGNQYTENRDFCKFLSFYTIVWIMESWYPWPMDGLEQKIDKLINTVEGIDKKLDGHIEFVAERMTKIEDRLDGMSTKADLQNAKQELFDKISENKYEIQGKVNDHEVRIQKLETNIA